MSPSDSTSPHLIPGAFRGEVRGMPLHTRSLTVTLRRTSDSKWLARGDVIDLRKNGFVPSGYDIQPSGIIHMMSIELDLDPATLRIEDMRVDQPFIAVEATERTEGECCRDPAPRLLDLIGEQLDAAFPKKLSGNFGGPLGCSHLLTLFQLMSSAIPRAAEVEGERASREATMQPLHERFFRRSVIVDGLQADRDHTDVSAQLADTFTRPISAGDPAIERLSLSHEIKIFATVEAKRLNFDRFELFERQRRSGTLATAEWTDHSARLSALVGHPVIPGLAKRIFAATGDDPSLGVVQDSLLMLAPAFIQITAAQMDTFFEERARAAAAEKAKGGAPAVSSIGGNPGACYMWREGGPVARTRFGSESQ